MEPAAGHRSGFRYGIATGPCERNPAPDLHGALRPIVVKHMAAVLEPDRVPTLMRDIASYQGQPFTRAALELSVLLFQRPGNIRQMAWAIAILRELHPLSGRGPFVFPSLSTGEMTPHGFRVMARTILVEQLNINPDVIEAQLAHGKSGPLGAAYDRAEFMSQRREMMNLWADYLQRLR